MVPDMRITLTTGGISRQVLHEIKVISSSQYRYKPSWTEIKELINSTKNMLGKQGRLTRSMGVYDRVWLEQLRENF